LSFPGARHPFHPIPSRSYDLSQRHQHRHRAFRKGTLD
jgi:hypothetical protein